MLTGLINEIIPFSAAKKILSSKADVEKQVAVTLGFEVAVEALITGDLIEIELFDARHLLSIDSTQVGSTGVITYVGSLYDQDYEEVHGGVLLTAGGGMFQALITAPAGVYQVLPAGGKDTSVYLLMKMKSIPTPGITDFPELALEDSPDSFVQGIQPPSPPLAMSGNTVVDVLVLYTPWARINQGGTTATVNWINTMVVNYNQKLVELGLTSYSLSLKVAKETKSPTFPQTYNENNTHNVGTACYQGKCDSIIADQYWIATNSTVNSLRNQYSADLVVLITANSRKHPLDQVHGYAGRKPEFHGGNCHLPQQPLRNCGDFVTVRDIYALSNLTFHHEISHAFGLNDGRPPPNYPSPTVPEGVTSFGWNTSGVEQTSNGKHLMPYTMMGSTSPVCSWSSSTSNAFCHVRLPFFADNAQYRTVYYTFGVPRKFGPYHHAENNLASGMSWSSGRK